MKGLPDKPLFRIDEVAGSCDVAGRTVRRWIAGGQLDFVRLERGIRVPKAALIKLLRPRRNRHRSA